MILTKEVFDALAPDEIFKIVITRLQTVHEPFTTTLKFICKKDAAGGIGWAIYAGHEHWTIDFIKNGGDKVISEQNIRGICPCDDEVYAMYRR